MAPGQAEAVFDVEWTAARIAGRLARLGWPTPDMHGNIPQEVESFARGE